LSDFRTFLWARNIYYRVQNGEHINATITTASIL